MTADSLRSLGITADSLRSLGMTADSLRSLGVTHRVSSRAKSRDLHLQRSLGMITVAKLYPSRSGGIMRPFVSSLLASLLVASTLSAQTRTIAERLGHPRDAKLLILHADDMGVAHSEDSASFDALDKGAVNSASVMMPTPWLTEVAAYTKTHPNADIGLHLTFTSEWKTYRWGGVAPREQVLSLYDPDGTLPLLTKTVVARAKVDEMEKE